MKKNLVIITGPTASGKSAAAVETAKLLNGEIVSADSMQIYKYMDIGSAKISHDEMQGIPHHMINIVEPDFDFSAALYREMAGKCIDDIVSRGKLPIVTGGTGLYINSLTYPLDFTDAGEDLKYREHLYNLAKENGNVYVHEMLKDIDIKTYEKLHPNDLKRIVRALEVYKLTGKTMTEYNETTKDMEIEYNLAYIGLKMNRQKLYDRINKRVDMMFDSGLIDEVKKLKEMGYNKNMNSMQGIGYKEIFDYLNGIYSIDEVKDLIKQSSRRYAKRQITWFKRDKRIYWIDMDKFDSFDKIIHNIVVYVEGKFKPL